MPVRQPLPESSSWFSVDAVVWDGEHDDIACERIADGVLADGVLVVCRGSMFGNLRKRRVTPLVRARSGCAPFSWWGRASSGRV
jgi:hypothetical protein